MSDDFTMVDAIAAAMSLGFAALWVWLGVRIYNRRERWAKWTAVGLAGLFILYVLSSGPMQMVAFKSHQTTVQPGNGPVQATVAIDCGAWWPAVYAPLVWASQHAWAEPLFWYWDLFPIQ